ncbi:unnamed protein product [Cylicocyclus nassatus]|uniref:Lipase n=1 Tax=Cylicocyclus nassatus TaxID=53992 RepID=A0AA36DQS1_CYLNA|nr:unnamed protein product [Cylicocyclus nassatus]
MIAGFVQWMLLLSVVTELAAYLPIPIEIPFVPVSLIVGANPPKPATNGPTSSMSVPQIVRHWGYRLEEHRVVTCDGYVLTLHRIPHGRAHNRNPPANRPVVFLQHGLLCSSSVWLLNAPDQSAGFLFAEQGYDVWLGNMRGNVYSKEHRTLNSDSAEFWRFSWEEMAKYDLPAMINYVLNRTAQRSLYYVGHSQGTLTMLAKLSKDRVFAQKIRKFFLLAPVYRMSHVKGFFHNFGQNYERLKEVYRYFGDNEFFSANIFSRFVTENLCENPLSSAFCEEFVYLVAGPDSNQMTKSKLGVYVANMLAGTSTRNMMHYSQMVHDKRMASFDMGIGENLRVYGQSSPPEYNISNVHNDIYLFYSDYDWTATADDVKQYLMPTLPRNSVKYAKELREFNHMDFLWGTRARAEIYDPIIEIIKADSHAFSGPVHVQ